MKHLIVVLLCFIGSTTFSQTSFNEDFDSFSLSSQTEFSESDHFNDIIKRKEVKVFPTPARHTLYIKGYYKFYNLFDSSGRKILSGDEQRIDVSHLMAGSYILTIHVEPGNYKSKKVLIR